MGEAGGPTEQQMEVLRRVSVGLSNPEIAKELCIARATVKNHLDQAYRRIGVRNRVEAARWVWEREARREFLDRVFSAMSVAEARAELGKGSNDT